MKLRQPQYIVDYTVDMNLATASPPIKKPCGAVASFGGGVAVAKQSRKAHHHCYIYVDRGRCIGHCISSLSTKKTNAATDCTKPIRNSTSNKKSQKRTPPSCMALTVPMVTKEVMSSDLRSWSGSMSMRFAWNMPVAQSMASTSSRRSNSR